jgi:hypothetical protein
MERLSLPFSFIPVATLVGGVVYLTESTIAPAPAVMFEPQAPLVTTEVPRTQLIPGRNAEPSTVAETASFAEPPTVVAAAEPVAVPAASDATPPQPRAVEVVLPEPPAVRVVLPVPKPKLARKSPELGRKSPEPILQPRGLPQAAFTPPSAPLALLQPDERPRSHQESGESNFAGELGVTANGGGR